MWQTWFNVSSSSILTSTRRLILSGAWCSSNGVRQLLVNCIWRFVVNSYLYIICHQGFFRQVKVFIAGLILVDVFEHRLILQIKIFICKIHWRVRIVVNNIRGVRVNDALIILLILAPKDPTFIDILLALGTTLVIFIAKWQWINIAYSFFPIVIFLPPLTIRDIEYGIFKVNIYPFFWRVFPLLIWRGLLDRASREVVCGHGHTRAHHNARYRKKWTPSLSPVLTRCHLLLML